MAAIDEVFFSGPTEINDATLKRLVIADNDGEVAVGLKRFKWSGKTVAAIVLELSTDNRQVAGGAFCVRGPLGKEIRVRANSLWQDADPQLVLNVRIPSGETFVFSDGSLASDYLAAEKVQHQFQVEEEGSGWRQLPIEEADDWGAGQFCLRLVASLSKISARGGVGLKYWVLIFPGDPEAVLNVSELAQHASWPGIALAEGEMALIPTAGKAWMCPLFPLLVASTPLHIASGFPEGAELRRCIDAILARSAAAEVHENRREVTNRWQQLANQPDSFEPQQSGLIWPTTADRGETSGV